MCGQELRVLCDKSSSPNISVLQEYTVPHSLEGFAGEVTFQLGFKASVGAGVKEGGWSRERTLHMPGLGGGKLASWM